MSASPQGRGHLAPESSEVAGQVAGCNSKKSALNAHRLDLERLPERVRAELAMQAPPEASQRSRQHPGHTDIKDIAARALLAAEAVCAHWLPDGKHSGREWIARNPTRADEHPGSFSINLDSGRWSEFATDDKGGDLVSLIAYLDATSQGQAAARLAVFLGASTPGMAVPRPAPARHGSQRTPSAIPSAPPEAPPPPSRHPRLGTPARVWEYRSGTGETLALVHRYDTPDGKEIRPLFFDGQRWQWRMPPAPRPLYGLERLSRRPADPVLICEGEKAADAAARLLPGLVVMTSMGGAKAADKADWTPLAGRDVHIWPDADAPGASYAETVARLAHAAGARSVLVLDLQAFGERPSGWDAADAEARGATPETLAPLLRWQAVKHEPPDPAPVDQHGQDVQLIRGSDLSPEPINWLWSGWLAAGKTHIFGGAPGTGKTTISMALAATVTVGGRWPDGSHSRVGSVVIWSGEDDPADTLIPRLLLSGADLSRVYFIAGMLEGKERRSFDPARDMEPLRRKLTAIGEVRLLIVDPIVSAITGDSHKNAEVRRSLQPLVDLSAAMHCALLGVTHFSKGTGGRDPVERLTGSLAFGALARIVLVAARHQEDGASRVRLFCRAKSNIGPDDGGFEYELMQEELSSHPGVIASGARWGKPVEGAARELLAIADTADSDGEGDALADAKHFLLDALADGPQPPKLIYQLAGDAGHSERTIKRAKKALGIEAVKLGMKAGWVWRMPYQDAGAASVEAPKGAKKTEECQQKSMGPFGKFGPLQEDSTHVEVEI